jgi:hypothetical protein
MPDRPHRVPHAGKSRLQDHVIRRELHGRSCQGPEQHQKDTTLKSGATRGVGGTGLFRLAVGVSARAAGQLLSGVMARSLSWSSARSLARPVSARRWVAPTTGHGHRWPPERADIPGPLVNSLAGTASNPRSSSTEVYPLRAIQPTRPSSRTAACAGPCLISADAVIMISAPARRYLAIARAQGFPDPLRVRRGSAPGGRFCPALPGRSRSPGSSKRAGSGTGDAGSVEAAWPTGLALAEATKAGTLPDPNAMKFRRRSLCQGAVKFRLRRSGHGQLPGRRLHAPQSPSLVYGMQASRAAEITSPGERPVACRSPVLAQPTDSPGLRASMPPPLTTTSGRLPLFSNEDGQVRGVGAWSAR